MFFEILGILFYVGSGYCQNLWPKGVVYYSINSKDYDPHTQEIITSVFETMEREICLKFFHAPTKQNQTQRRVLHVANPEKLKDCPPRIYNFSSDVVEMPIGYRCINRKDIARIIVDMLRASIDQSDPISSYDIMKKYHERDHDASTFLSPDDRNFINTNYYAECGSLTEKNLLPSRRTSEYSADPLSYETKEYYNNLLWPLGIVMYGISPELRGTSEHTILKFAMTTIELSTCIVFEYSQPGDALAPNNLLWFDKSGDSVPAYGFKEGNQTISLYDMVIGAPGHTAHPINNLLRAIGIPMMSNRYDRDNYVSINWQHLIKGQEHLLEKLPESAWVTSIPYDFHSVTHAPANFACRACQLGATTVEPVQDHLWQRTLAMGHRTSLTESDIKLISLIYGEQCQKRLH